MLFFRLGSEVADYNIFPELLDISFSFSFKEKRNCQQEIIIVRRFFPRHTNTNRPTVIVAILKSTCL